MTAELDRNLARIRNAVDARILREVAEGDAARRQAQLGIPPAATNGGLARDFHDQTENGNPARQDAKANNHPKSPMPPEEKDQKSDGALQSHLQSHPDASAKAADEKPNEDGKEVVEHPDTDLVEQIIVSPLVEHDTTLDEVRVDKQHATGAVHTGSEESQALAAIEASIWSKISRRLLFK